MYLVVFKENHTGYHFYDKKAKLFKTAVDAIQYANKLNGSLALQNHCVVKVLDDYYDIVFVPIG